MYKLITVKSFYFGNKLRVTWEILGEKGIFQELPVQLYWFSTWKKKNYSLHLWIVRKYALSPKVLQIILILKAEFQKVNFYRMVMMQMSADRPDNWRGHKWKPWQQSLQHLRIIYVKNKHITWNTQCKNP